MAKARQEYQLAAREVYGRSHHLYGCGRQSSLNSPHSNLKKAKSSKSVPAVSPDKNPEEKAFGEIMELIQAARVRSLAAVNTALIDLYWQIGQSISRRIDADGWGKNTVAALARYIQQEHPNLQGFSVQNLWRMRQFFESYRDQPVLSSNVRSAWRT